jgi:hypothetical protein
MKKKWIIAVLVLLLISVFYITSMSEVEAQASQSCTADIIVDTRTGEYSNNQLHPPDPLQFDTSNLTTITCGTPRTISILDGCPPFNWSVSGTGYALTDVQGNERSKILNCSGTT